jgi:HSP20 family protein
MALPILRRGGSPVPVRRHDGNTQTLATPRLNPWDDFALMDRLFDNFFRSPFSWSGVSTPATGRAEAELELYENQEDLIAYLYAPGLDPGSFDISASENTITVKGERKPLQESAEGLTSHTPWAAMATSSGSFTASYDLPVPIDPGKVQARYKDGVLNIRMPKSEAAKPKQVKVQVGSA